MIIFFTDIFIGFQLPSATYPEIERNRLITIIKGAGNITEQRIAVAINLVQTTPPGSSFDTATPSMGNADNDLVFGENIVEFIEANENELNISVTIFDDTEVERTEAAQLTLEVPTDENITRGPPPRFEILPEFPNFFIIIEDNDRELDYFSYTRSL